MSDTLMMVDFPVDYLEAIIAKSQRASDVVRVLKAETGTGIAAGENYTSDIRRIKLKVRCKDALTRYVWVIIKVAPAESFKRSFLIDYGIFNAEIKVYRDVFSAMERILEENHVYYDLVWGRMLDYETSNFIVFEDLTPQGYKLTDRKKGLDFDHACLAFGALARFHAMSVILKDKECLDPAEYGKCVFWLETDFMKSIYDSGITAMVGTIRNHWEKQWHKVADDLETVGINTMKKLKNVCTKGENSFHVLCQGDPWTTNMLFKYCPVTGRPIGIKLIDFQAVHFGSYAIDLNYTLFTSVQDEVREERLNDLLKVYHKSLMTTFEVCNHSTTNLPSYEDVIAEVEKLKFFGVVVVCSLLHFYLSDEENAPDLDSYGTNETVQVADATLRSELYTRRGMAILKEFKDKKFFSLVSE